MNFCETSFTSRLSRQGPPAVGSEGMSMHTHATLLPAAQALNAGVSTR